LGLKSGTIILHNEHEGIVFSGEPDQYMNAVTPISSILE